MGPDTCQTVKYSALLDSTYTDLSFYRLQVTVYYCSYTIKLIRGVIHLDISFICWFRVITRILFFSGVFRSVEVEGDKGSGNTTTADV
jgi:hypothetical protein